MNEHTKEYLVVAANSLLEANQRNNTALAWAVLVNIEDTIRSHINQLAVELNDEAKQAQV